MAILQGIKLKDDETVHQLDYESGVGNKPELVKSWNDLEDKPFEVIGSTEVDILAEQEVTAEYVPDGELAMSTNAGFLGLKTGETYLVNYDGVIYECVGFESDGNVGIGNGVLGGLEDTGEPFLIGDTTTEESDDSAWMLLTLNDTETTTHTVRIYQSSEDVKTLDPKFVDAYTKEETMNLFVSAREEVTNLIVSSITSALNTEV